MTEERRYGINWVDLIIKVILLILFVLLICWLFPMPKLDTFYDKVFNDNIQTMKNAARNYYTVDRLPDTIGETKTMSLKQLIDSKIILEFSDKDGKACDTANSYVQVTKTLDSEYALKVQLTCGDESDYIIDTIGCNGTCLLSEVNDAKNTSTKNVSDDEDSDYDVKLGSKGSYPSYTTGGSKNYYYYPLGGSGTSTTTIIKYPSSNTTNNNTTNNNTTNNSGSGNSGNSGSNHSSTNKTKYYQQAKIVKKYGSWVKGYKTGSNIQNKSERINYYYYTYYTNTNNRTQTNEYRTTTYITPNEFYYGYGYNYEIQLTNIPSSVNSVSLASNRYFYASDYQAYLNNRDVNLYMSGNNMLSNSSIRNATQFSNASLKSGQFTYSISNPYKSSGVWRVRVTIQLRSNATIPSFYDSYLNKNVYFVPLYFQVRYNTNSSSTKTVIDSEANAYKYNYTSKRYAYSDTINYYRYINQYVDYSNTKWSTSRYLDGYQFTGNTKYM